LRFKSNRDFDLPATTVITLSHRLFVWKFSPIYPPKSSCGFRREYDSGRFISFLFKQIWY